MLTRISTILVFVMVSMTCGFAANADASCPVTDNYGTCAVASSDEHGAGDPSGGNAKKEESREDGSRGGPKCVDHLFRRPVAILPCISMEGTWLNADQCYASPMQPQPQASDPIWPKDKFLVGDVYECRAPAYAGGAYVRVYWAATTPGALARPDPLALARQAIAAMRLTSIDIGLAPKPSSNAAALIGLPIWMWVDHPRDNTWGPITRSASDRGLTVTATASVDQVKWTMGDGSTVSCGAGTPRPAGGGSAPSPTCGHSYSKSIAANGGDPYAITATSHWTVRWSAGTITGTIPLDLQANAELAVVESHPVLTAP